MKIVNMSFSSVYAINISFGVIPKLKDNAHVKAR